MRTGTLLGRTGLMSLCCCAMPIEFDCPTCRTKIRTPDGTEGKAARCPKCSAVVTVPAASAHVTAELSPAPAFSPSLPASPSWPPSASTPPNPYAAPGNVFADRPFPQASSEYAQERARSKLLLPAIGLITFGITGLGFMALVGIALVSDPNVLKDVGKDPAERAGAIGFFVAYFSVGLLTRFVQLLGAIAMLRMRGYALAMAGAISALVPCEIYCCLPTFPLGIWALILLNNAEVKAAFRRD